MKQVKDEEFSEVTAKGLVLVDFYADWCGPCRMLTPVLEELSKEFEDRAQVIKVNIDESQKTTASHEVTSIPTLILFKEGQEVDRVVGVKDEDFFKEMLQAHL